MDRIDDFEQGAFTSSDELVSTCEYRRRLVKKIYRIMKKKGGIVNFGEMRERALR